MKLRARAIQPPSHRCPAAFALLLALCCTFGCGPERERPRTSRFASKPATATPPGAGAGADSLTAIDGPALLARIRDSGHKGTIVNVWASWCGSCKRELPMIVELAGALQAEGMGLILVSADEPNARTAAHAFLAGLSPRPPAPTFIVDGPLGPFKRALNPAWKGAIPSTFLFDAAGELRYFWPGPVLEHEISNIVSAFLAGRALEGPTYVEPDRPPT
jgi:cytochrome c biogenesis protein CcmG, thiol:disulfide interchange protein DsbE